MQGTRSRFGLPGKEAMEPQPQARHGRVHYAWIVAALMFIVMLAATGIRSAPSVLIVPLEKDLGWSRVTVSFALSINLVLFGVLGPFAAALVERFGMRRVVIASLVLLSSGVSLSVWMTQPWQLVLLWGVVVGGGTAMIALATAASIVNTWFVERRGLVMGLLSASFAAGQLIFLPLMAWVTANHGWRPMVLLAAGAAAVMIPVVGLWLRNRPADLGLRAYGAPVGGPAAAAAPRANPLYATMRVLGTGLRNLDFWLLGSTFFVCGLSTNGLIGTHLIPACIDAGMAEVRAAGLVAAMGVFNLAGTTLSGWLSDRWNNRSLLFWYYGLRGLSLLYLPFALDEIYFLGLSLFTVFYGLDWIATVPPTARLTTDVFGKEDGGIMFGWIMAMHQVGAGVAAYGAGLMRTAFGLYDQAFIIAGVLCIAAALASLRIGVRGGRTPSPVPAPQAGR
jgi:MFS family permease